MVAVSLIDRLLGKAKRRSLDAGAGGRRWEGTPNLPSLNRAMEAAGTSIRQRAAYYARNNPYAARAINSMIGNAVGAGIQPQSRHEDPAIRARLAQEFQAWSDQADASGRVNFFGFQALVFRQLLEAGESFIRFIWSVDTSNRPTYRLQMIHPDQVDATLSRDLDGGRRIRAGVELDANGRPIAYHVLPARPADAVATDWRPVRIPSTDMIHVMEVLEPGQVRGLSHFASVLLRLQGVDKAEDAQLMRQMVAAMFAGFIIDPTGDGAGFEGTRTGNILETGLEPGTLKTVPPGYDIRFSEPANVGDGADFLKGQLRAVAAGLGVTYEQMTGDLSGVNYSSIRAGLIEFRRRVDVLRWHVLIPQFCRPVWERFIQLQVLRGRIGATEFHRGPEPWLAADWFPPGWEWVDPLKDTEAEKRAVEAGFKSRSQVINERGEDPDSVDTQRAADMERERRLFPSGAGTQGAPPRHGGGGAPNFDEEEEDAR